MLITEKLEHQPNFPREDLSEANALWLGLAMGNVGVLERGHRFAEYQYRIFRGTHEPLAIASKNIFDSPQAVTAIDFGIKALEAMTLLVGADEPEPDEKALELNINNNIVVTRNKNGALGYFEQAHEVFMRETPRIAQVIHESARHHDPRLAILGGAIARQFEIDNIISAA